MNTPRVKEDDSMSLTLSYSSEVTSRQAATIELQAAAVETRGRTRTIVDQLTPGQAGKARPTRPPIDIVWEWGMQSFPASDPPMNW